MAQLGNATSCSAVASCCASAQMAYERRKSLPEPIAAVGGHLRSTDLNWPTRNRRAEVGPVERQQSKGLVYPPYDVQPRSARLGAHNAVRGVEDVPRRRRLVSSHVVAEHAIRIGQILAADLDLGKERQRLHS